MGRRIPLFWIACVLLVTRPALAQGRLGYFFEAGGNGGFASLNLDFRVGSRLHARAGGGLVLWPTVPLTATWLIGSRSSALEIGGGATIIFFPPTNPRSDFLERFVGLITIGQGLGTVPLATGVLAYRHESPTGSTFRVAFTPFYGNGKLLAWFGISLGGRF